MALQILIRGRRSILFYRRETEAQRRPGTAAHPGLQEQESQAMGWGFSICCRALGPPMLTPPSGPAPAGIFIHPLPCPSQTGTESVLPGNWCHPRLLSCPKWCLLSHKAPLCAVTPDTSIRRHQPSLTPVM